MLRIVIGAFSFFKGDPLSIRRPGDTVGISPSLYETIYLIIFEVDYD
jgi:hypothetical protein